MAMNRSRAESLDKRYHRKRWIVMLPQHGFFSGRNLQWRGTGVRPASGALATVVGRAAVGLRVRRRGHSATLTQIAGHSIVTASPPFRVIKARRASSAIDFLMNLALPSAKPTLNPVSNWPPSFGSGLSLLNCISSGLVQGTGLAVSTTINVLAIPSVMAVNFVPSFPSNKAPGPKILDNRWIPWDHPCGQPVHRRRGSGPPMPCCVRYPRAHRGGTCRTMPAGPGAGEERPRQLNSRLPSLLIAAGGKVLLLLAKLCMARPSIFRLFMLVCRAFWSSSCCAGAATAGLPCSSILERRGNDRHFRLELPLRPNLREHDDARGDEPGYQQTCRGNGEFGHAHGPEYSFG